MTIYIYSVQFSGLLYFHIAVAVAAVPKGSKLGATQVAEAFLAGHTAALLRPDLIWLWSLIASLHNQWPLYLCIQHGDHRILRTSPSRSHLFTQETIARP